MTTSPRPSGASVPAPDERVTGPVTLPAGHAADPGGDRAALVDLCIDLADRLRTAAPGLRARAHPAAHPPGAVV